MQLIGRREDWGEIVHHLSSIPCVCCFQLLLNATKKINRLMKDIKTQF